eukprot:1121548-Rhodomonas_salina.1
MAGTEGQYTARSAASASGSQTYRSTASSAFAPNTFRDWLHLPLDLLPGLPPAHAMVLVRWRDEATDWVGTWQCRSVWAKTAREVEAQYEAVPRLAVQAAMPQLDTPGAALALSRRVLLADERAGGCCMRLCSAELSGARVLLLLVLVVPGVGMRVGQMGNGSVVVLRLFPDTPVHPCPVPVLWPAASDALPQCRPFVA